MSQPFPFPTPDPSDGWADRRRNWLGRYLTVENQMDQEVYDALVNTANDIDGTIRLLTAKKTKSAAARRLQLSLAHKEIRAQMSDLFGPQIIGILKTRQADAAEAAVNAALSDEKRLLSHLFSNPEDQAQYAASLRQTARRNIESVMVRVLATKQPLSKRVYKTGALARGMVDRAINNGLAKGDSAENIARHVRDLINPDVPGGVSYAAKRLARTELNNAFHAQSIHDAQEKPWNTQMRWNLSKVHRSDPKDPCEDYARQGLFDVKHVPDKPHPNCRCFVVPEQPDLATVDAQFLAGTYDNFLDNFISGGRGGPLPPSPPTPPRPPVINRKVAKPAKRLPPKRKPIKRSTVVPITKPRKKTPAQRKKAQNAAKIEREAAEAAAAAAEEAAKAKRAVPLREDPDFKKAKTPADVGALFAERYPHIALRGWDKVNMGDVTSAREIAGTLDTLLTKFPNVPMTHVEVSGIVAPAYAHVEPYRDGTTRMRFNPFQTSDRKGYKYSKRRGRATRWNTLTQEEANSGSWEGTVIHEFGHILDFFTGERVHKKLMRALSTLMYKERPNWSGSLRDWMIGYTSPVSFDGSIFSRFGGNAPSGYSVHDGGLHGYHEYEIIAEAFADVTMHGDKAKSSSRVVYDLLMDEVRKQDAQ